MKRGMMDRIRRFGAQDDGVATIPFAIWTPLVLILVMSGLEMGAVTLRHATLERALDTAVRDLRLGTGDPVTPAELKSKVCERAPVLTSCESMLHLEMVAVNVRNYNAPTRTAPCADVAEDGIIYPSTAFQNGGSNQMMFLRACFKYKPITPAGTLSSSLPKDDAGFTALISTSAFVHEPS